MRINHAVGRPGPLSDRQSEIQALAEQALAIVADRIIAKSRPSDETYVRDLCNAFLHPNKTHQQIVLSRMSACGISSPVIYEKYLPAVAHLLGERWVRDEITFVDVTKGSHRLQDVMRVYGREYVKSGNAVQNDHTAYMCVPDFENHSVGVFMAANQLRRMGVWVQLGIGVGATDIIEAARRHDFSMIGISAASNKSVAPICGLVDKLRSSLAGPTKIVIGGNIVNCGVDLLHETGADLVTCNIRDAALHCGMIRCLKSAGAT
ncbi:MAG: cobalamin B12-binding domain-containing protein [Pseudomonadota bacterium]